MLYVVHICIKKVTIDFMFYVNNREVNTCKNFMAMELVEQAPDENLVAPIHSRYPSFGRGITRRDGSITRPSILTRPFTVNSAILY